MPSIAVLCEFPTLLGGERSWLATLPAVREAGFSPFVIGPPVGPLADAVRNAGVPRVGWTLRDGAGRRLPLAALRRSLHELLVAHQPDLVHANSLTMTRLSGPVLAGLRMPGVGYVRDIVRLSAAAVRDMNLMPRLLAVSEATRRFHVMQGVDERRISVLYNGVDLREFAPRRPGSDIAAELQLPPTDRIVVSAGQISVRKGTDVFVELARNVLQRRSSVQFLVVGERTSNKDEAKQFEADIRRKAAHPPCRGHVHFLGVRQDMPDLLARADLVIHPARQEPLGRVLLESAAAGKAVIATDVGGTSEIFPHGSGAAVLVPVCDVAGVAKSELLAAALRLLEDETTRTNFGVTARRRAEEAFDAQQAGRGLAQRYTEVLAEVTTAP